MQGACADGLGFVGLTLAVALADVGFEVHGVEKREDVLERLRWGEAHFHESGIDEALHQFVRCGRLRLHDHVEGVPRESITAYIVTVGTPLGDDGRVREE